MFDAADYTSLVSGGVQRLDRAIVSVVFAGGCVITALFFMPSVMGITAIIPGFALIAAAAVYFVSRESLGVVELGTGFHGWGYAAQLAVYGAAGIGILVLALMDFIKRRDAYSVLLGLWVFGTLAFTIFFNWTVNGRSILPMVPAVAILLVRAAEEIRPGKLRLWIPLVLALAASLLVTWADYRLANSSRDAARAITAKYSSGSGQLWFQGHWGFQYYLEESGAKPLDWKNLRIMTGDPIAFPFNNSGLKLMSQDKFAVVEEIRYTPSKLVSTMTPGPGAGFYASEWGPLPFMIFPPDDERYQVLLPMSAE